MKLLSIVSTVAFVLFLAPTQAGPTPDDFNIEMAEAGHVCEAGPVSQDPSPPFVT